MSRKRVYVAGPMRGYPLYNFPAFDAATVELRGMGFDVISPAEMDRALGFDPSAPCDVDDAFIHSAMRRDIPAVAGCDAIYLLRGWSTSTGARREKLAAEWFGCEIMYQPELPQCPNVSINPIPLAKRLLRAFRLSP